MPQRQSIRDDFESSPIENVDPCPPSLHTCATACSNGNPLSLLLPPPKTPTPARCTMMAKGVQKVRSRKGCASILVIGLVGTVVKTADANAETASSQCTVS